MFNYHLWLGNVFMAMLNNQKVNPKKIMGIRIPNETKSRQIHGDKNPIPLRIAPLYVAL